MPPQQVASEPVATPATTKIPLIESHLANNDPNVLGWSTEDRIESAETAEPDEPEAGAEAQSPEQPSTDASQEAKPSGEGEEPKPSAEPAAPQQSKLEEQFAALMARDRELTTRERALRDKERDVEQRTAGMVSLEDLKRDPQGTIAKAGLSFQQLVDMQINGGKPTADMAIQTLTEQVQALTRQFQERDETAKTTAAETEKQQAVDDFKGSIKSWVDEHTSECPIVSAENQIDLVYSVIDNHYRETNRVLEVADAVKYVEEYLRPQRESTWKALGLSPSDPPPESDPKDEQKGDPQSAETSGQRAEGQPRTRTLTNNQTAVSTPPVEHLLSDEESIARAAEKLRFIDD